MTKDQLLETIELLSDVEDYLINDIDAMCNDDYIEHANKLLNKVRLSIHALKSESQ